jgi:hypothetical protein
VAETESVAQGRVVWRIHVIGDDNEDASVRDALSFGSASLHAPLPRGGGVALALSGQGRRAR